MPFEIKHDVFELHELRSQIFWRYLGLSLSLLSSAAAFLAGESLGAVLIHEVSIMNPISMFISFNSFDINSFLRFRELVVKRVACVQIGGYLGVFELMNLPNKDEDGKVNQKDSAEGGLLLLSLV